MSGENHQTTYVVGTAGHVDHGKSTLVRALTGIDPDRLREEKDRQLTIDLGFAWLELPNGTAVSIVDVPGHERFIKNMLAGVGGIDAALLVIAADEGPMPQTREHLAILDLLGISTGIIVISKSDLVDQDWLDLVQEETRESVAGTTFAELPIIPVSATTGAGLPELITTLEQVLADAPHQRFGGRPRLPLDRVFSVAGFGTVVTGTLLGSQLAIGDEVEILPSGIRGRVRGLQSHGTSVEIAQPGRRTAINISGVDRDQLTRGDVVAAPGWLETTSLLDARLKLVEAAPRALKQNDAVDFFIGAAEHQANVTLLDAEKIEPGHEGWVQMRFSEPVVAVEGDLFIIRQASPSLTIGGGQVINPHPRRHRRFRDTVISELETRATGTPIDRMAQLLTEAPANIRSLAAELEIQQDEALDIAKELVGSHRAVWLQADGQDPRPTTPLIDRIQFDELSTRMRQLLADFHERSPLRFGMPRQETRSRISLDTRMFEALVASLASAGQIDDRGEVLALHGHEIALTSDQEQQIDAYLAQLDATPYSPPSPEEVGFDTDLLPVLEHWGKIIRLSDSVIFAPEHLAHMRDQTLQMIAQHGEITLAQFRDHFGTTRKYAQAVLEHFDAQRVTRRVGDVRVSVHGS